MYVLPSPLVICSRVLFNNCGMLYVSVAIVGDDKTELVVCSIAGAASNIE
jgi:hypothetical protein